MSDALAVRYALRRVRLMRFHLSCVRMENFLRLLRIIASRVMLVWEHAHQNSTQLEHRFRKSYGKKGKNLHDRCVLREVPS